MPTYPRPYALPAVGPLFLLRDMTGRRVQSRACRPLSLIMRDTLFSMNGTIQERPEIRAQLILDVAKAASSHLELPEVLESLIGVLKPMIRFDAISVFVIEGEYARLHSLHVERVGRRPGESVECTV